MTYGEQRNEDDGIEGTNKPPKEKQDQGNFSHLRSFFGTRKKLKIFALFSVALLISVSLFAALSRNEDRKEVREITVTGSKTLFDLVENETVVLGGNGRYYINATLVILPGTTLSITDDVVVFGPGYGIEVEHSVLVSGTLSIRNSVITSGAGNEWSGINCSGKAYINGSALLNASTAVAVQLNGVVEILGSTITNSGTAVETASSSTELSHCLITGNEYGLKTDFEESTGISATDCQLLNNSVKDYQLVKTELNATGSIIFTNGLSSTDSTILGAENISAQTEPQTNYFYAETGNWTPALSHGIYLLGVRNASWANFTAGRDTDINVSFSSRWQFVHVFPVNNETISLDFEGQNSSVILVRLYNSTGQRTYPDLSNNDTDFDSDGLENSVEWVSGVRWYEAEEFGQISGNGVEWNTDYERFDDVVLEKGTYSLYLRAKGFGELRLFTDEKDYTLELNEQYGWYKTELELSTGMLGLLHTDSITIDKIVLLPDVVEERTFSWYLDSDSDEDGIGDWDERVEFFEVVRLEGAELRDSETCTWDLSSLDCDPSTTYRIKAVGTVSQAVVNGSELPEFKAIVQTGSWNSTGNLSLLERIYTNSNSTTTLKPMLSLSLPEVVNVTGEFNITVTNTGEAPATNVSIFALNREGNAGGLVNISGKIEPGESIVTGLNITQQMTATITNVTGQMSVALLGAGTDLTVTAISTEGASVQSVLPVTDQLLRFKNLIIEEITGASWLKVQGNVTNGSANHLLYGIDGWEMKTAFINTTTGGFDFRIPKLWNGSHVLTLKAMGVNGAVGVTRLNVTVDHRYRGGVRNLVINGNSAEISLRLFHEGGVPLRDTDVFFISNWEDDMFNNTNQTTDENGNVNVTLYSNHTSSVISIYLGRDILTAIPDLSLDLLDSLVFVEKILETEVVLDLSPSLILSKTNDNAFAGGADWCELELETSAYTRFDVTSSRVEDRIEVPAYTNDSGKATIKVFSQRTGEANITVRAGESETTASVNFSDSRVRIEKQYLASYYAGSAVPDNVTLSTNSTGSFFRFEVNYLSIHNKTLNPFNEDVDGDGLLDGAELENGSSPWLEDTDGDGLSDWEEVENGTNPTVNDTDDDGIEDAVEINSVLEYNATNSDTDGDGLPDGAEDKNYNGLYDGTEETWVNNSDTDGDGMPDSWERKFGLDPCDPEDTDDDPDGDGLDNLEEFEDGTNPRCGDTDGDAIEDKDELDAGLEPTRADTDGDRIWDGDEVNWDDDTDGDGTINALDTDSDNDTIDDYEDGWWDSDIDGDGKPSMCDADSDDDQILDGNETIWWVDTDGDGLPNFLDTDSDNDGLEDWEEDKNLNGSVDAGESSPFSRDTDGDGLNDYDEVNGTTLGYQTSPAYADTDNDTISDLEEWQGYTITYWDMPEVIVDQEGEITTKYYLGKVILRTNANITIPEKNYSQTTWLVLDPQWRDGNDELKSFGHLEDVPDEVPDGGAIVSGEGYDLWGAADLYTAEDYPVWVINESLIAVELSDGSYEYYGNPQMYPGAEEATLGETDITPVFLSSTGERNTTFVRSNATVFDTDGDGLPDNVEKRFWMNPTLADTDGDGLSDSNEVEVKIRTSGNYTSNLSWVALNENDVNLTFYSYNGEEIYNFTGGNLTNFTTPEGYEIYRNATNSSIIRVEINETTSVHYLESGYQTSYPMDGYSEIPLIGSDPLRFDTDGDGLPDGVVPGWEYNHTRRGWTNTGPVELSVGEQTLGTNPLYRDTDCDNVNDGIEVAGWYFKMNDVWEGPVATNPCDPDSDDDGLVDGLEYLYTNATAQDTDTDGLPDSQELQVVFRTNASFSEDEGLNFTVNGTEIVVKTPSGYKKYNYTDTREGSSTGDYLLPTPDGKKVFLNGSTLEVYHNVTTVINETSVAYHDLIYTYTFSENVSRPLSSTTNLSYSLNYQELYKVKTSPINMDSDGDGLPDGWIDGWNGEYQTGNQNGNGEPWTGREPWEGEDRNLDGEQGANETNPCDPDTDSDGVIDGNEYFYDAVFPYFDPDDTAFLNNNSALRNLFLYYKNRTDPEADGIILPDIDNDSLDNALDPDSDNDGIPDGVEDRNRNGKWDGEVYTKEWKLEEEFSNDTGVQEVNMSSYMVIEGGIIPVSHNISVTLSSAFSYVVVYVNVTDYTGEEFVYTHGVWVDAAYPNVETMFEITDEICGVAKIQVGSYTAITIHEVTVSPEGSDIFDLEADHPIFGNVSETCPYLWDSDFDGLSDEYSIDFAEYGIWDKGFHEGEKNTTTHQLDWDSDDDWLLDGNNTHHGAEDQNNNGTQDSNETNWFSPDTDGDGSWDGYEYYLILWLGHDSGYRDSDGDGKIDLLDTDSDNDGLNDSQENFIANAFLDKNVTTSTYMESDPTDWDCDNDGLLDGAEPQWWEDCDDDGYINVWDQDSGTGGGWESEDGYIGVPDNGTKDYNDVYVVFRTNATDSDGDGLKEYDVEDTWILVDSIEIEDSSNATTVNLTLTNQVPTEGPDLRAFSYNETITNVPNVELGNQYPRIQTKYKENYTDLSTPDGKLVYNQLGFPDEVYIFLEDNGDTTVDLAKYSYDGQLNGTLNLTNLSIPNVANGSLPNASEDYNYVYLNQETYDPSIALDNDMDGDGLNNTLEGLFGTDPEDADSDDDGIMDGDEPFWWLDSDGDGDINANDPDSDDDGLNDGTEMGVTEPTRDTADGDDFVADADPSTTTDMLNPDTDGDGLNDGVEDEGINLYPEKQQNGKYDEGTGETDPLNPDTDFDGLKDGTEDSNHDGFNGIKTGEASPIDADSDDDGVKDGDEHLWNHNLDGDENINVLDTDSDGDGIEDGTELGMTSDVSGCSGYYSGTDDSFVHDQDPSTVTDPTASDTDNDGIDDGDEDSNHDGSYEYDETDPNNPDTDFDGLKDGEEDKNADGEVGESETDPRDKDSDDDGIGDWEEIFRYSTVPNSCDSDDDGIQDGTELGITTGTEGKKVSYGSQNWWYKGTDTDVFKPDADPSTTTNPKNWDSDGDGIGDGVEDWDKDGRVWPGKEGDPNSRDTDGDGIDDLTDNRGKTGTLTFEDDGDGKVNLADLDSDGDGLTDNYEYFHSGTHFWNWDTDYDGLADGNVSLLKGGKEYDCETDWGTNATNNDTDGDGLSDGYGEVEEWGTDPLNNDSDNDGLHDGLEAYVYYTDPWNPDTDGDEVSDSMEIVGWTVPIVYFTEHPQFQDQQIPHNTTVTTFSNPLRNESKVWDIDEDNIPDWVEQDPENATYFGDCPESVERYMDYVEAYNEFVEDYNANMGNLNFSQYGFENFKPGEWEEKTPINLSLTLNPRIRDLAPPELAYQKFNVETRTEKDKDGSVEHCWAEVTVEVYDPAGIWALYAATPEDSHSEMAFFELEGGEYHTALDIDYEEDAKGRYTVLVSVTDQNYHNVRGEQEVDGRSVLKKAGDFLVEGLTAGIKCVMEAVLPALDWIWYWIREFIDGILDVVVEPLKAGFQAWVKEFKNSIDEFMICIEQPGNISALQNATFGFATVLLGWYFVELMAVSLAMSIIGTYITVSGGGAVTLARTEIKEKATDYIKMAVIAIVGTTAVSGGLGAVLEFITGDEENVLSKISSYLKDTCGWGNPGGLIITKSVTVATTLLVAGHSAKKYSVATTKFAESLTGFALAVIGLSIVIASETQDWGPVENFTAKVFGLFCSSIGLLLVYRAAKRKSVETKTEGVGFDAKKATAILTVFFNTMKVIDAAGDLE